MKWGYQSEEAKKNKNWSKNYYKNQHNQSKYRDIAITERRGSLVLILELLMLIFILLGVYGVQQFSNRINYLIENVPQIKATVVDSSDNTKMSGTWRWSELEFLQGNQLQRVVIKYSFVSTKVGDVVSIYYEPEKDKAFVISNYVLYIVVCALIILFSILKAYGYLYDFYVQKRREKQMKTVQK